MASRFSDLHFIAAYLAENVSIAAYRNGELAKPEISFARRDFGVPVIGCVELEGAPENRKVRGRLHSAGSQIHGHAGSMQLGSFKVRSTG